jgi:hypothetical protein
MGSYRLDAVRVAVREWDADWLINDAWLVRFTSPDSDAFAAALALMKSGVPTDTRYYVPPEKAWVVRSDGMQRLAARWPALGEAWRLARMTETQGWAEAGPAQGKGKRKRSRTAPPPPPPPSTPSGGVPAQVREAFAALHLHPDAPALVVQAVYRALARQAHPDIAGGDEATMKRINLAYERAREWAERREQQKVSA